ncbi:amino acid synthesis family protein [Roseibium sp. SCP14]|uniref:amino acid synthesis family protein n=1 Tax=Roseibium sp. SCP14 TaxID=3141375 RepID=UPI00333954F1
MKIRKISLFSETIFAEAGENSEQVIVRVAAAGIIANPFSGRFVRDLSELFELGGELGTGLMEQALPHLPNPAVSYGKAALVGVNGDLEHGHALLHPKLGKAMREPIGGGEALIPSAAKVGAAGATLDVPLGHKDDAWSFAHFDAMPVCVPDSPRPDEIMMVVALADGGRPNARVGTERMVK